MVLEVITVKRLSSPNDPESTKAWSANGFFEHMTVRLFGLNNAVSFSYKNGGSGAVFNVTVDESTATKLHALKAGSKVRIRATIESFRLGNENGSSDTRKTGPINIQLNDIIFLLP
jgi:hypothetical protein